MHAAFRHAPTLPRRRPRGLGAAIVVAGLALLPKAALAQETREYDLPQLEKDVRDETTLRDHIKVAVKASNRFVGMADFGDYRANSYQPEFRVRVTTPVARNAGIRLMATGRMLHYDFSKSSADLGIGRRSGGPLDSLFNWNVRLQGAYLFDEDWTLFSKKERWSVLGDGFVRSNWEKGADMTEAVGGGASLAVGYRLGKRLNMAAGLSARTVLRTGRIRLAPVAEIDWRINRNWKISTQGIGLEVRRKFGEEFEVFSRARWEGMGYLLDNRSGIGDAYLRIRQLPVGLGMRWDLGRRFRVTTLGGVMAIHKLTVKDSDGKRLDSDSADPSPYFLVRFDFRT